MNLQDLNSLKPVDFPFLLGSTSYVIPADILPNVRRLAPLVDDIELVIFETPEASNMLSAGDVRELRTLARDHAAGFTVHLPTDNRAGSPDAAERGRYRDAALRVMDMCAPLEPRAWIAHLEGIGPGARADDVTAWSAWCRDALSALSAAAPEGTRVAVENLDYPWIWHGDLAESAGCALCCDVGHLWRYWPETWETQLAGMLPRSEVLHVHGVAEGKDHRSLRRNDPGQCLALLQILAGQAYAGVLTLEVFSESNFVSSLTWLRELWVSLGRLP
jgi:sugar phosphate isomerase/epimerase